MVLNLVNVVAHKDSLVLMGTKYDDELEVKLAHALFS